MLTVLIDHFTGFCLLVQYRYDRNTDLLENCEQHDLLILTSKEPRCNLESKATVSTCVYIIKVYLRVCPD